MTDKAKKLLMLYEQSGKRKTLKSVPPLTFKGYGKNLKNYRIYGNTETLTRSYSGTAPLSFPIVDGAVSNYRIYGNTENGESVGDLVTDSQSGHYGKYAIPVTNNAETANIYLDEPLRKVGDEAEYVDYAEQKRYNADGTSEDVSLPALPAQSTSNSLSVGTAVQPSSVAVDVSEVVSCGDRTANLFANLWKKGYIRADNGREEQIDGFICSGFFPVEYGQTYSISRNIRVGYDNIRGYKDDESFIGAGTDVCDVGNPFPSGATKIGAFTVTNENVAFIRFNDSANDLDMKYMIVDGTYTEQTMPSYEPYGYRVPVTVTNGTDTETTNLYLPEQIKMVGDEAEYIDFREQKQHFVDGTSTDITLPAMPTLSGTNTLTVGTEVQPSKVEIAGKIKQIEGEDKL